jgi:predicted DNA-binding transcriptional regulator AlpA
MSEVLHTLLVQLKPFVVELIRESVASALEQGSESRYPERINVTQASELTGYTKNSLYQMHSKGQVPGALKVGGKLMFDTETLRNWVYSGGQQTAASI